MKTCLSFNIGDPVIVNPARDSLINFEFEGRVKDFRGDLISVVDQEDNLWDCDANELERLEA